jgi:hypothetical protein
MNYTKPEVKVLGQAVNVIEGSTNKNVHNYPDGGKPLVILPAYDLDE